MASFKLYLDIRKRKDNEPVPVVIILSHKNKTAHIATGVKVLPEEIDMSSTKNNGKVIAGENRARKTAVIHAKKMQVQRCLFELTEDKKIGSMSVSEIKQYIMNDSGATITPPSDKILFADYFSQFLETKKNVINTYKRYKLTLSYIANFCKIDKLSFAEIDNRWLHNFDSFLIARGLSLNSRALELRSIRAVFNFVLDNDISIPYPFRRFKIKTEPTKNRDLSVDDLRRIIFADNISEQCIYFRDMFLLSFFLIGINTADMYSLTQDNIKRKRIEYTRAKTHKFYSILIPDGANILLKKYRGKNALIDMQDRFNSVANFSIQSSLFLKSLHNKLSMYWARHTWATIAYNLGISTDVIALALGHSTNKQTTNIYINPNLQLIDEANRKVLDFVLYDKK